MSSGIPNNIEGRWYINGTEVTKAAVDLNTANTTAIDGTATNDSAAAGDLGEYFSASVAQASAVSISNGAAANVTSISLTAGDWDVWGNVVFLPANTTSCTSLNASISTTSAALDATLNRGSMTANTFTGNGGSTPGVTPASKRISIASTSTIYLVAFSEFSISTNVAFGNIHARRVR